MEHTKLGYFCAGTLCHEASWSCVGKVDIEDILDVYQTLNVVADSH
jgi:hypothetical protein